MNHIGSQQLRLVNGLLAERIRAAADARRASEATAQIASSTSFRRSVGHQIIRIGERLAAEPHLQPARSR